MKIAINSFTVILLLGLLHGCAGITLMSRTDMKSKAFTPETHSIVWGSMEVWDLQTNKDNPAGISTKFAPYDLTFRQKLKDKEKHPIDGGYRTSRLGWQHYDAIFVDSFFHRGGFYLIVPPGNYEFHHVRGRDGANTIKHAGPDPGSETHNPIKFSVKKPGTSYYIGTYKAHFKNDDGLDFKGKLLNLLFNEEESSEEKTLETSVDKINNPSRKEILGHILKKAEDTPWKEILK